MAFNRHDFINRATHLGMTRRQAELLADSFGSAASSVVGIGDWLLWNRNGLPVVGGQGFDYVADTGGAGTFSGTTVIVGDDAAWVDHEGYATSTVTEDGAYTVQFFAYGHGVISATLNGIFTDTGAGFVNTVLPPLGPLVSGDSTGGIGGSMTLWLPANTHLEIALSAPSASVDGSMALTIQRVAGNPT